MILWIKRIGIQFFRTIFTIIPLGLVKRIISSIPRLFVCAPQGITYDISDYLGQFRVKLDTTYAIERKMLSGEYEVSTSQIINKFVREGDVCFDIGANVGPIMFYLARKATSRGKIYAFEPGPPIFERLASNVSFNPKYCESIIIENLGVGEKNSQLHWSEELRYVGRGNGSLRIGPDYRNIIVDVVSLDSYCQKKGIEGIDFIKIDVEGMEYEVLKGAKTVLEKYQPIIYYETLPQIEKTLGFPVFTEIKNLLESLNYKFYSVDNQGNEKLVDKVGSSFYSLAIAEKLNK